jgi:hypothetical protein
LIPRELTEEEIDWQRRTTPLARRLDREHPMANCYAVAARCYVDVVRFDRRRASDLAHGHAGGLGKNLRQQALSARHLVDHDNER